MSHLTLQLNGRVYELTEEFTDAIERRAKLEYEDNERFTCYWTTANRDDYTDEQWESNIHDAGDPLLVIDTTGPIVPWERLDQLEAGMQVRREEDDGDRQGQGFEDLDGGGGNASLPPEAMGSDDPDIFGRKHFTVTPHSYQEVPSPDSDDESKIPPAPEEFDDPSMVLWVPRDPEVEHSWSAGEAIVPIASHIEWNVQKRADQPRRTSDKPNSHDAFESLCKSYDCKVVEELQPTDEIPEDSGSVQRKGKEAFEKGRFGGSNWNV